MDNTDVGTDVLTAQIEAAFNGRWAIWLSGTGRWWAARTELLIGEHASAGCVPFIQAATPAELTARLHEQDELTSHPAGDSHPGQQAPCPASAATPAASSEITLDDLRRSFGSRWEMAHITGGYRATPRQAGGHTPVPRYGRTPAELAESIWSVEQ